MNFIFLVPSVPLGGAELQVSYLAKYINSIGKDRAKIFAADKGECDGSFGLDFMQTGKKGGVKSLSRLFFTFLLAFKIFSRNDVLVVYNQLFIPLGLLLKLAGMKVVYSIREYDERVLSGWRLFFLKRFDFVFTNTVRVTEAAFDKGFNIPCYLNYLPFSENASHVGSGFENKIVMVSNVQPHKNIHIVIKAMVGLDFDLDVLGKTDNEKYLKYCKNLAAESGVVVNFRGFLEHGEMLDYLRNSDLFLHPSSKEGTSNAILSAIDVGVPLLVSDIAENRYIIDDEKYCFPVDSYQELRRKVINFDLDSGDMKKLRLIALEKFSAKNLEKIHRKLKTI